jgi:hemoglobin-like flavoprotein
MKIESPTDQAHTIASHAFALAERVEALEAAKPTLKLAGSKEAAELLDVHPHHFHTLRKRRQLPAPVAELACGPVWRVEDIEAWARVTTLLRAS